MGKKSSSDIFNAFFIHSIDLLCIADTQGFFRKLNPEWERTLGYPLSGLEGKRFIDFVHPEDREKTLKAVEQLSGGKEVAGFVNRYWHADGSYRWIEWRSFPADGMIYASARDITAHVDLERSLKESEEKYLKAFLRAPVAVTITNMDTGRFVDVNDVFLQESGFGKDEVTGRTAAEVGIWADAAEMAKARDALRGREHVRDIEVRMRRRSGEIRDCVINGEIVEISAEKYSIFYVRDVTERKRAEEALLRSARETEGLMKSMVYAFVMWETVLDGGGRIVDVRFAYINDTYERYAGVRRDEVMGKRVMEVFPETEKSWFDVFNEIADTGAPKTFEMFFTPTNALYACTAYLPWGTRDRVCVVFEDITERRRAEERFKRLADLNQTILDTVTVGLAFVKDRKFEWINEAFSRLFGYAPRELEGQATRLIYKDDENYARVGREGYEAMGRGEIYSVYMQFRRKDGSLNWFHLTGKALYRDDPMEGSVWMLQDINERKLAEDQFRELASLHQTILDTVNIGISFLQDRAMKWMNSALCQMFGYEAGEITGKSSRIIYAGDAEYEETGRDAYAALGLGKVFTKELRMRRKNGESIWIHLIGKAIDPKIPMKGSIWMLQDITDRKSAELALRQSESVLKATIDSISDGLIVVDEDGIITQGNRRFAEIFRFTEEELAGGDDGRLYLSVRKLMADPEGFVRRVREIYGTDAPAEDVLLLADGRILERLSFPLKQDGPPKGRVWVFRDITERRRAEEEIRRLNADLEKIVEDRTAQLKLAITELESFTYSVSHDLRAPIRHIGSFLELMYAGIPDPTPKVSEYHAKIAGSARRMSTMIESLLSFARLGRKTLEPTAVDIGGMVRDIVRSLAPDLEKRVIEWDIGPLPTVSGDAELLRLSFENLIANAVKYTSKKEKARIAVGSRAAPDGRVEIFVRDNGAGFDMAHAGKLFGVFQRLHTEDEFEGIGIGLANVKQIVEKHGGTVRAESRPGEGAAFYVELPAR